MRRAAKNSRDERARRPLSIRDLASPHNRGILLDVIVFVLNLLVTRMMTRSFASLVQNADEDSRAQLYLGLYFSAMLVLPAAGAILKRWPYHYRRALRGAQASPDLDSNPMGSCLFNPVVFFCLALTLCAVAGTLLFSRIFGEDFEQRGGIFATLIVGSFAISIVQTVLVYRFFSPPPKAPRLALLRDPRSELLGDACLYLNMLLFQVLWNALTFAPFGRVKDFSDFAGRLLFITFAALLVYFPPRVFYLAEDIHRRAARLTILLANAPVIIRILS